MKKIDVIDVIPLAYQNKRDKQFTLSDFAETVAPETLLFFLIRVANEIQTEEYRSLILKQAAETLGMDIRELHRMLTDINPPKPKFDNYKDLLRRSILCEKEFMTAPIEPRPFIMEPWLKTKMIVLISASRGVGKTWFALSLALAITRGTSIGPWKTTTPLPCLYVDGEMVSDDLQGRLIQLTKNLPEPVAAMGFLSADMMQGKGWPSPNLAVEEWRDEIYRFLKDSPYKVVVFDNLACLTPGLDENSKGEWDPVNLWLLSLRFLGMTVIMIHHQGKSKAPGGMANQRGTSGREDAVDVSITLSQPSGKKPSDGCQCTVDFTKSRSSYGDGMAPFIFSIVEKDGGLSWDTDRMRTSNREAVIALLGNGLKQAEIAARLGIDPGTVSKIKTKVLEDGFLKEEAQGKFSFTVKGKQLYGHIDIDSIPSGC
jgi:hypothetical protein